MMLLLLLPLLLVLLLLLLLLLVLLLLLLLLLVWRLAVRSFECQQLAVALACVMHASRVHEERCIS
jgi:high-affinity Fe2+/Pb2+ permease